MVTLARDQSERSFTHTETFGKPTEKDNETQNKPFFDFFGCLVGDETLSFLNLCVSQQVDRRDSCFLLGGVAYLEELLFTGDVQGLICKLEKFLTRQKSKLPLRLLLLKSSERNEGDSRQREKLLAITNIMTLRAKFGARARV